MPEEFKAISVNVGSIQTANGSALARVGNVAFPEIDLPALGSLKFKPGPPLGEAQVLSERLNKVLVL